MPGKATTAADDLSELPDETRATIEVVRAALLEAVDDQIEEGISYGMKGNGFEEVRCQDVDTVTRVMRSSRGYSRSMNALPPRSSGPCFPCRTPLPAFSP